MLVLSRKANQKLIINDNIEITILEINGGAIKIGVKAPPDVQIYREEIYKEIQKTNRQAHTLNTDTVDKLSSSVGSGGFDLISKLRK